MATLQQCLPCQCNQAGCEAALLFECAQSGFAYVRSCLDPLCAPWCSDPVTGTSQAVTGISVGDAWLAGAYGAITGGRMNGCGCGCGAPSQPAGTATGPLTPAGKPIGAGCACATVGISWWLILAIIAFFVLVNRKGQ